MIAAVKNGDLAALKGFLARGVHPDSEKDRVRNDNWIDLNHNYLIWFLLTFLCFTLYVLSICYLAGTVACNQMNVFIFAFNIQMMGFTCQISPPPSSRSSSSSDFGGFELTNVSPYLLHNLFTWFTNNFLNIVTIDSNVMWRKFVSLCGVWVVVDIPCCFVMALLMLCFCPPVVPSMHGAINIKCYFNWFQCRMVEFRLPVHIRNICPFHHASFVSLPPPPLSLLPPPLLAHSLPKYLHR